MRRYEIKVVNESLFEVSPGDTGVWCRFDEADAELARLREEIAGSQQHIDQWHRLQETLADQASTIRRLRATLDRERAEHNDAVLANGEVILHHERKLSELRESLRQEQALREEELEAAQADNEDLRARLEAAEGESDRRPCCEWERVTGVRILDPDGWRGGPLGKKAMSEPITLREWDQRMMISTCEFPPAYFVRATTTPATDGESAPTREEIASAWVNSRPEPTKSAVPDRTVERLVEGLKGLKCECNAILHIAREAIRDSAGNTNLRALEHHVETAHKLLKELGYIGDRGDSQP